MLGLRHAIALGQGPFPSLAVFTEIKILRDVDGAEEAQLNFPATSEILRKVCRSMGNEHNFTRLVPDSSGKLDPTTLSPLIPASKACFSSASSKASWAARRSSNSFLRTCLSHIAEGLVSSQSMRDYFLEFFGGG